ncbi:unnamed protein product [Lactuca saligna]|uniref:Uncharacterized protein n=1 Tax=Lactuca saligna TaxID=75948 RepID=A0AA35YXI9_LACSI|nr:unnamed protein product [Lactuca saligna]
MILDEIDRESNEISPPDGDEVFLGVYELESESKTNPRTLPPNLTSCLPSPLPLTTVEEEKYGKPMGLISNQGGMKEKFTIQYTLNLNGKYLNTWIEAAKQVMIPISRPPPPSPLPPPSPPPPPLLPGIDEKNGGTMMESKRSSWEKTTPFNNRLEWGYPGYTSNGLKNDNWAAIDSWGSQLLNRKIDWVLTRKQNINPLVNKATDQRFVNWNENNHVYPNQLPSPSPTPAMAYVFQRDRKVRSSSRTEWKERKKKDLSFHGGSQVRLSHKCHKCKEDCNHYAWDANQVPFDQLSKNVFVGPCQILELFGVVANSQSGLSDNELVFVTELCVELIIQLGCTSIEVKSLVSKYGNTDLILGMEWLTSFGKVIHNWDTEVSLCSSQMQELPSRYMAELITKNLVWEVICHLLDLLHWRSNWIMWTKHETDSTFNQSTEKFTYEIGYNRNTLMVVQHVENRVWVQARKEEWHSHDNGLRPLRVDQWIIPWTGSTIANTKRAEVSDYSYG